MNIFNSNEVLVYTGTLIEVQAIKSHLFDAGITSIENNRFNSGIMAGFGESEWVQLYVDKEYEVQAKNIIAEFLDGRNFLSRA